EHRASVLVLSEESFGKTTAIRSPCRYSRELAVPRGLWLIILRRRDPDRFHSPAAHRARPIEDDPRACDLRSDRSETSLRRHSDRIERVLGNDGVSIGQASPNIVRLKVWIVVQN